MQVSLNLREWLASQAKPKICLFTEPNGAAVFLVLIGLKVENRLWRLTERTTCPIAVEAAKDFESLLVCRLLSSPQPFGFFLLTSLSFLLLSAQALYLFLPLAICFQSASAL
jgi:hypothetical protein